MFLGDIVEVPTGDRAPLRERREVLQGDDIKKYSKEERSWVLVDISTMLQSNPLEIWPNASDTCIISKDDALTSTDRNMAINNDMVN